MTPDQPITSVADLDRAVAVPPWNDKGRTYFRGLPADYPLIPSLGRREAKEFPPAWITTEPWWHGIEERIRDELCRHYRESFTLHGPGPERPLDPMFMNDWHWLTLAQHHGLPTQLLDWSLDYRVALFFAVANGREVGSDSDGVVWCFHDKTRIAPNSGVQPTPAPWDRVRLTHVRPYSPTADGFHLARVRAQKGAFTHQPDPTKPLDQQLRPEVARHRIQKLVVPSKWKEQIRKQLATEGISVPALFPDMAGVCDEVRRRCLPDVIAAGSPRLA